MDGIVRSLILSFVMAVSLRILFETFVSKRHCRYKWMEYTDVFAWMAVFMWIALSEIPPYLLQPVRTILVIFVVAQIYYRIKPVQNLILSVLFCAIYWIISILVVAVFAALPMFSVQNLGNMAEVLAQGIDLCLIALLCRFYRKYVGRHPGTKWGKIGYYPVFALIVIMAISMMIGEDSPVAMYASLVAVAGFGIINVCFFYFVLRSLKKEEELQQLSLLHERTKNQMEMYRHMQKSYEQQRRFLHDYKNQLNCIQGMLETGQTAKTMEYITGLTGSLRKNADHVNTNHIVVNVVLNQKYQEAWEKGITMTMVVNDLSEITINEADIVTLLVNLLDNAIEACEKLEEHKVIQFKMIMEKGQLILSVRNPVKEPVEIRDKRVVTSKPDTSGHGIGLRNVDSVIRKNDGTSVITCAEGWFYFSAMFDMRGV